jgi:hypothetical protein
MQRRAIVGALLLIGLGVVLGATVFRTDIARAAGLAKAQPVEEQNLDGDGDIRVHEQGTASVQGTVSAVPAAPGQPWSSYSGIVDASGFDPVLAGPRKTIDLTSLAASVSPGSLAYISLIVQYVPDTAADCTGASGGSIVYALNNVSGPVTASWPTPLVMTAPAGQRACLFGAAGGTGGSSGGGADLNATGFYG